MLTNKKLSPSLEYLSIMVGDKGGMVIDLNGKKIVN